MFTVTKQNKNQNTTQTTKLTDKNLILFFAMFVPKKVNKCSAPLDLHHETHCFGIQM